MNSKFLKITPFKLKNNDLVPILIHLKGIPCISMIMRHSGLIKMKCSKKKFINSKPSGMNLYY